MSRTILDACVEVLKEAKEPLSAEEIHQRICERQLFEFKAKDPVAVVRATIRKHLRKPESHRLKSVDENRFLAG